MNDAFKSYLQDQIDEISESGLYKAEHPLTTAQGVRVEVEGREGKSALNFCANNYLGLAQNPEIRDAAIQGLREWGYGLASVRFI